MLPHPVITTCPPGRSQNADGLGQSTVPNLVGEVVATDNCGAALTITQSPVAGTVIGIGVTTVTMTVRDAGGNETTCTVSITVVDSNAPVITTCPPSRSISADGSCQASIPDLTGEIVATDNTPLTIPFTQSPVAGTIVGLGVTTVTFYVEDDAGNITTCTADLTIVDDTAPVPDLATLPDVTGECEVTATDPTNCNRQLYCSRIDYYH